jgi:serine/threonine protein kinase
MAEPAIDGIRKFGQYEVESVLGRGAMGMVYLARDRRIGRKVALKTVQLDQKFEDESEADEFFKRLQREAEVVGAMQHPNIVTLYEPGYENNVISYLATEYVDGESLKDRLKRSKPLPVDEALKLGEDILRGLAYAHTKGIIHRDIKPANILLSSEGQAKLADFGIARPIDSNLTAVGSMLGTPNYMSPEQVKCSPVTTKADLFSTGIVIYEMLTGQKPFAAADVSGILRNVVEKDPKLASEVNPLVPEAVARFVERLLAKTPEARFESAGAALAELQKLRSTVPAEPIEEIAHEDALGTISTGSNPSTATTQQTQGVSAAFFWAVVVALAIPVVAWAVVIRMQTDPRPVGVITTSQRADYALKKQALRNARALSEAGQYDQSIQTYDTLLQKYPGMPAAMDGRADAVKRLEAAKAKTTVTTRASRPKRTPKQAPEEQKKPSLWQRLIHRGKK